LPQDKAQNRISWLYDRFKLEDYKNYDAASLPLGVRQRLSLAVAIIHEPEILILDEPTSGVDPIARDNFWALLIDLSRNDRVTIFISTHFMSEAARCDRISLMNAGKVLATGAPAELQKSKNADTLEDAFIAYLEEAIGISHDKKSESKKMERKDLLPAVPQREAHKNILRPRFFSGQRMIAYMRREILEMMRDPVRLSVATLGTSILMLVFGYGITLDVNSLRYAALDLDRTPDSRAYLEAFGGSAYFETQEPIASHDDISVRLREGSISMALEIPPGFGKRLHQGRSAEIGAWIDGSMPFRAETIGGYVQGIHARFLQDQGLETAMPLNLEMRYLYNQSFESLNAMVPSVMGLLLIFIPAVLSALSVVREKEMGSIANFYVTPVTKLEFILGKQAPYIVFAMISFLIMLVMAIFLFQVPLKGSALGLTLGALAYVSATTGIGFLMSSFTKSQIAALFGVSIATMMPATQFSGMLQPVATLEGLAYWIGTFYPTTYFLKISIGSFTKGLDFSSLLPFISRLFLFAPALLLLNVFLLKKQET